MDAATYVEYTDAPAAKKWCCSRQRRRNYEPSKISYIHFISRGADCELRVQLLPFLWTCEQQGCHRVSLYTLDTYMQLLIPEKVVCMICTTAYSNRYVYEKQYK